MEDRLQQTVANVSILTGAKEDESSLIELIVRKSAQSAKDFCNREDVPDGMWHAIEDLACYRYNKIGREGVSSEGMGTSNISFETGIPEEIKSILYKYRLMRFL